MRLRLGRNFVALSLITALITVIAIPTHDTVLGSVGAALIIAIAIDLLRFSRAIRSKCVIEALGTNTIRMWVGQEKRVDLKLVCPDVERIEVNHPIIKSARLRREGDHYHVELTIRPDAYGSYVVSNVVVYQRSPLSMFSLSRSLSTNIKILCYPRAWLLVLIALAMLRGGFEGGESIPIITQPLRKSIAGEYYSSREYVVGDPIIRIDWKASSRVLKLVVKEFIEELRRGTLIILNPLCLGPRTCDAIASSLLSIAMASYLNAAPLAIYDDWGRELLELQPHHALMYAIRKAFELTTSKDIDPYELLEPMTSRELLKILTIEVSRSEVTEVRGLVNRVGRYSRVFLVSTLVTNVGKELDVIDLVRARGIDVEVHTYPAPWRDVEDLEDAYEVYRTYRVVIDKLRELGCVIKLLAH